MMTRKNEMLHVNVKLMIWLFVCVGCVVFYFRTGSAYLSRESVEFANMGGTKKPVSSDADQVVFSGYSPTGKGWQVTAAQANLFAPQKITLKDVTATTVDEIGKTWTLVANNGQYQKQDRDVYLEGNVVILSDAREEILTDALNMNLKTDELRTDEDIKIVRNQTVIEGTGATAERSLATMTIDDNVRVTGQGDAHDVFASPQVTITCDGHMDIDYKNNFAIFYKNVKVVDQASTMYSDEMHVFFDQDTNSLVKAIAFGNVVILTENKRAVGEHAVYFEKERMMVMTGHPYVYRDSDVITAEKITFYTDDGRMVCEPTAKLVLFPSTTETETQEQI